MAINFPNSPNPNDTHSSGGKTWIWDGTSWKLNSSPATGIGYTDLSVSQVAASGTGTLAYNNGGLFTYTPPDLSGFLTSIPIAAAGTLGGVKIGSNVSVTGDGTISVATPYTLPTAGVGSGGLLGGVKVDGTTITISAGVITASASAASQITVADETTDTSCYVVFVGNTPGGQAAKTGSLLYNAASGQLQAGSFKKDSGTSSEFLKADGSIDSSTYLTSQVQSDWNATTGAAQILNKPTIPAAQVQSDWGQTTTSAVDYIKNKPTLFSGNYTDLTNKPFIPDLLGELTDVSSTTPSNNDVLKWNGTNWAPATDATGGGGGGISLTDLSVTTNSVGTAALSYDNSTGVFSYTPPNLSGYSTTSHNHSFISITGTPSSYDDGKWLRSTANSVEWVAAPSGGISGITIQEEGTSLSTAATTINFTGAKVTASGTGASKTVNVATPTLADVTTAGNSTTNDVTVNNLNVDGNLTVSGTTTTIDTATLNVADNLITLNSNYSGGSPTTNGGIEVERGTAANVALRWNETSDKWQFTNDGSNYSDIGSSTTDTNTTYSLEALLSPGVKLTGSDSTTDSVFFDSTGGISITRTQAPGGSGGGTITFDTSNVTGNYSHPNHSGDVTSAGDGATTIANDAVTYAKMQNVNGQKILGRKNTGSGAVAELTPGEVRTLINVADGAEVNVQSDWNSSSGDSQILNKPTGLLTSVPTLTQVTGAGNSTSNAIEVGNCTVTGNLSIDGLVGVSDEKITLNSDFNGSSPSANVDVIVERGTSTNVRIRWNESTDKWTATNDGSNYFDLGGGVPQYTIVMYHGSSAPSGWAICNGSNGTPDLRDKFVVAAGSTYTRTNSGGYAKPQLVEHSHNYNMTSTGSSGGGHSHSKGNFSLGTSTHNGHTHGSGNYDTGNQSTNHYHTIGGNKPNGQAGVWQVNTSQNGGHGHGFQTTNSHPQSNMDGIETDGGDGGNINNAHIQTGGAHNHTVNLTGVTTGGVDSNHTHAVSGNSGSDGNHSHNVNMNGNTNNTGTHDHSFTLGDSTNNSGITAITNNSPSFNHRNLPPYYSVLFIMKT